MEPSRDSSPIECPGILARARAGDQEALGEVLKYFEDTLRRQARIRMEKRLNSKVSLSDLVQNTFVRAIEQFGHFRGEEIEQVKAWLLRILNNEIKNCERAYHTGKRDVEHERGLPDFPGKQTIVRSFPPSADEPVARAIRKEQTGRIYRALRELSGKDKTCFYLRCKRKLAFEEIGGRLGCTPEAARKRYHRVTAVLGLQIKND